MKRFSLVILFISLVTADFCAFSSTIHLTNGDGDNYGSVSPSLSPDGKKIAYASSKNGTYHIWIMDHDGTNKKEITDLSWDMSPAWSPTDEIIAFNSYGPDRKSSKFSIWMVDLKSNKAWKFMDNHPYGDQYPCWSPDGQWIVWTHGKQLWISSSHSSDKARPLTKIPAKAYEFCGDWDPSGKWIAYLAADTHDHSKGIPYKIWMIRADGEDQKLLFDGISASKLRWSRHGNSIYFSTAKSIFELDLKTGEKKEIMEWENCYNRFDISPDGQWIFFDDQGPGWAGNIHKRKIEESN